MDISTTKKLMKRDSKKKIAGVKLPPIETLNNNVKTIVDIDPDYYSLVQGRPIRPNTSINKYKQSIKDIALKRTLHGFLIDEITRIGKEIETERNIYATASKHFDECQHSFDKFLAHDNDKTIVIMKTSDNLAKDLANQTEEHKKANFELASIKAKVQYTQETLLILLSLENFLHKASPILWQENENVKIDVKHSEFLSVESDIFQKVDINALKQKLNNLPAPTLYFKTPQQLLTVFELMEKQNLNYLLVTEELNIEKNKFIKAKDHLKDLLHEELDQIQRKIKEIKDILAWNEHRETELKEIFFRVLEEKMKYLISSETTLQLLNYVEFAYEKLIAPNDTSLDTLNMARALETTYDNLMLDLAVFDLNVIKAIEKEVYSSGVKEMKKAKDASKLLKDVDKLNRRLKSSFEPPKM